MVVVPEGTASPLWYGLGFSLAALSGALAAVQSGVNATLGAHGGQAFASCISFTTGLASCLVFFAFDVTLRGTPLPSISALQGAPGWSWTGGPMGAFYVVSMIVFAPKIGAGNFMAVVVSCQLATAVVLDLLGSIGYVRRTVSWPRLVGVVLMVAGVALITAFPGRPVKECAEPGGVQIGRALTHLYRSTRPGVGAPADAVVVVVARPAPFRESPTATVAAAAVASTAVDGGV